jgi:uncharacterized protein (TIGR02246 family)
MQGDEPAIRDLVQTWLTASAAGDLDQILTLTADDVVCHTPGREAFGKAERGYQEWHRQSSPN